MTVHGDLTKRNGEFGGLKYKGRRPSIVKVGTEADVPTETP